MVLPSSVQLPLFVLDKRCSKCGETKPLDAFSPASRNKYGRRNACKACRAAEVRGNSEVQDAYRRYYAAHIEREQEKSRTYARTHTKERRAYELTYRRTAQARIATKRRQYRQSHKEENAAKYRAWMQANPDYHRTWSQRLRREQPEKPRAYAQMRRSRTRNAPGSFAAQDIRAIYVAQGGCCAYCGVILSGVYHIEHKQPLSRGGSNWPGNLCCSCPRCNLRKGPRTEQEFRAFLLREQSLLP